MQSPHAPEVTVLLPLYNGSCHLTEQLGSLLDQTYPAWHCLMRDDGSSDDTVAIARCFERYRPDRFTLIEDRLGNLGVVGCLNELARRAAGELFALCDQDDVWQPEKLKCTVDALLDLAVPPGIAALAFCDMTVSDNELHPIARSFWDFQQSRRYAVDLRGMPVFNAVAGCTMVGNRALLSAAFPVPACAPMHDYWIALVARYCGVYRAVEKPLMMYRQHGRNQRGAARTPRLWQRVFRRASALQGFVSEARRARTTRLAMLNELLVRQPPRTDTVACRAAIAAESGSLLSRLSYLRRTGINPAHAFTYWIC